MNIEDCRKCEYHSEGVVPGPWGTYMAKSICMYHGIGQNFGCLVGLGIWGGVIIEKYGRKKKCMYGSMAYKKMMDGELKGAADTIKQWYESHDLPEKCYKYIEIMMRNWNDEN